MYSLLSSYFDDTKKSTASGSTARAECFMLATKLLEAAHLVGLSQSDIARHFGISRAQVHLWASGKRAVPKKYCTALVTLVSEAKERCLALASKQPLGLATVAKMGMGIPVERHPADKLRECINALFEDWRAENLEAQGFGPTRSVREVLEALEHYKTMAPEEMRKPANAQQLQVLSAYLQEYATMLRRMSPLLDSEEEKDADDLNEPREPGRPSPASALHHEAHVDTLAPQQS
jgi:DNA-binding transcriptional regulator YiaG